MSFSRTLTDLLKTDQRFLDESGELVIAAVQDKAWNLDHALIRLLLTNDVIKAKFFDDIDGHLVFNINTFIDFVAQKNFLDNSYTRFRNKIGLTIGGKLLSERGEVSLVWPYRDCVLEGGQTKEEENRQEIFFNEVLAKDEIDRLLSPKVFTGFRRFVARHIPSDANRNPELELDLDEDIPQLVGFEVVEEPVACFRRNQKGTIRENLMIKGNNLMAMHSLLKQFRGQVKLIYIDPPYNTGNDTFGYNDRFNHSSWLTFMANRLQVARTLLSSTGMVFVQCDETETAYLRILMDSIFGRGNILSQISWQRAPEGRTVLGQGMDFITDSTEYILAYAMDTKKIDGPCPIKKRVMATEKALRQYDRYMISVGRRLLEKTLHDARGNEVQVYRHEDFEIVRIPKHVPYEERLQNFDKLIRVAAQQSESTLQQAILAEVDPSCLYSVEYVPVNGKRRGQMVISYYYENGIILYLKDYAETDGAEVYRVAPMNNFWSNEEIQITGIADEGAVTFKRGKKPELLLQRIIEMATEPGDLVLDFHIGSGTTCAVAQKLGRQWIGIEQLDYSVNNPIIRLANVIRSDQTGISKSIGWHGGGDFIYCELMKYNEIFMDRIQDASTKEELIALWKDMAVNSFLKWYVNPKVPDDAQNDFMALGEEPDGLNKQKRLLAELLDKNQLYVNLSEIDDAQFKVSEEDRKLNTDFYRNA